MSETKTVWHKWPETQPRTRGRYIVTEKIKGSKAFVSTMFFNPATPHNSWGFMMEGTKILAWAELPEPYEPDRK